LNKTCREDVVDANILASFEELQVFTEQWIDESNNQRQHQSLDCQTPN
jgi:hypothetical protein